MTRNPVVESLLRKHAGRGDLHITRVLGTFVAVSGGEVIDSDRSGALACCPFQSMLSKADVEDYIREKMLKFGHFTGRREIVRSDIAIPFGASEMLMRAVRAGVLDCAVTACDGAGTVVAAEPEVIQGIGARMNGLFHTSPIPEVRDELRRRGCIVFDDARIDQVAGLKAAIAAGRRKIGVTVNSAHGESLDDLRATGRAGGADVMIAAVCSTGVSAERALEISREADLSWSCASGRMRAEGRRAVLQITLGIPVFVFTRRGLDVVAAYSDEEGAKIIRGLDTTRHWLLATGGDGPAVRLGEGRLRLSEAVLPVAGKRSPEPLR